MISLKLVSVFYLGALCCLLTDNARASTIISSLFSRNSTNTTTDTATPGGSWSADLQEEIKIWMEENTGKSEPRGLLSSASKLVESFLFDDGVPSDVAPFSSATPEEVAKRVVLHLYTNENGDHNITGPVSSLERQGFRRNVPTTLLIHGYGHNATGAAVQPTKNRILATASGPVNVIGVDWGALCPKPHYVWSRANVKPTGEYLGQWLAQLVQQGLLRPSDIHIVGHSLGAHVAGTAGSTAGNLLNTSIARVTGLDPAYPLFARATPNSGKISPSDAALVDVIHTAAGRLGLRESVGHVDFYVNGGGVPQPGCGTDLGASCSHERVCFLYAESVGNPATFPGRLCPDDKDVSEEKCTGVTGHMGESVQFSTRGKYYVKSEDSPPFDPETRNGTISTNTTRRL